MGGGFWGSCGATVVAGSASLVANAGLHVHFAVGRYVSHHLIRDVWGRGRIHIKLIGDLPVGSGALEDPPVGLGELPG